MAEMLEKQQEHDAQTKNLKQQLADITHTKTVHLEGIAAVVSQAGTLQQVLSEKEVERDELETEFAEEKKSQKGAMRHIMFNKICAVRMIRNSLMGCSETS